MKVFSALRGVFRHLGVHQFPGRIRKQRCPAVITVLHHEAFVVALDVRDAAVVQVRDDFVDRPLNRARHEASMRQSFQRRALLILLPMQRPHDAVDDVSFLAYREGHAVFIDLTVTSALSAH